MPRAGDTLFQVSLLSLDRLHDEGTDRVAVSIIITILEPLSRLILDLPSYDA